MEQTATVSEEPSIRESNEPPIVRSDLPVVAPCAGDCSCCPVNAELRRRFFPMGGHAAQVAQSEFNAGAFGYRNPGDRYTRRLDQKETALEQLRKNVAGCTKIVNGTRVRIESMVYHAQCALEQELAAERALYVEDDHGDRHEAREPEDIEALLHSSPINEQEAVSWISHIRSLLGG